MPETSAFLIQAAHEQAIQALIVRVGWAIDHGDMDALVSCLHPDVAFVRPDGQVLQGPQAVRDAYARRDPDRLTREDGDLWDSGEVKSDQSVHVAYAGKPLASDNESVFQGLLGLSDEEMAALRDKGVI